MGRKQAGKWRVQKDELCLDQGTESGCFEVWLAGNKVELRPKGSGLPREGVLQKPTARQWAHRHEVFPMFTLFQLLTALLAGTVALLAGADQLIAQTAEPPPLQLESKIPLGDVRGRIDHLAIDLARQRLFVAELGNDSVGIVDLKNAKLLRTISGFKEPQGVAYLPEVDTLYVANAGDGSVRLLQGESYAQAGRIELGQDADNIRVDPHANRVFVGYGEGALAVIDPASRSKLADIPLPAHPESFQLSRSTPQVFVNVPKSHAIAVVDRESGKQTANWATQNASGNFPMALDDTAKQVLVVFRSPAQLGVFAMSDGSLLTSVEACADADDIFLDAKRRRVYISCGEGYLDVFDAEGGAYKRIGNIPTVSGARTALFVAELDRLFLAVRAAPGLPAAIWIFRPTP
jgi:DNA-binding beta-propeller fold protein YncE